MPRAGRLCRQQHLAGVRGDAVAEPRHLAEVEPAQPRRRLLDLDPLVADQEAIAPAAHGQGLLAAGGVGGEKRLEGLARLLGAQSRREEDEAPGGAGSDVDVHLAAHPRAVAAEGQVDATHLLADPPHQHPLQFFQLAAGDEVPEQAAKAVADPVPAVLLGEAVVAVVDFDQVIVVADRVVENLLSDRLRLMRSAQLSAVASIATALGTPSRASSALRADIATQVKVGVSRSVYSLDSVGRSSLTRSRNIPGSSPSKQTTNSWSSRPKE